MQDYNRIPQSENNKESRDYVEFVFYRVPKKNHEKLVLITKRLIEFIKKEEVVHKCYGLIGTDNIPGFSNISKVIPINPQEEDIWINMITYKNREHRTKVIENISNNKECLDIYEVFMQLLTPGTGFVNGEFRDIV